MMKGVVAALLAVLSAICLATPPVAALDWPTRPVRIVTPFAAWTPVIGTIGLSAE